MEYIFNIDRIGIEAELRSYMIKGTICNKIVLAISNTNIEDYLLKYPLLQLVSEGNNSGTRYFELVFGPVRICDLNNVLNVINIARRTFTELTILQPNKTNVKKPSSSKINNIKLWVDKFNSLIIKRRNLSNYKLTVYPNYQYTSITPLKSNVCSIQANLLVPIKAFSNCIFVEKLFKGCGYSGDIIRMSKSLQNAYQKLPIKINDSTVTGLIFLTAYFCYIYNKNSKGIFSRFSNKQIFPILPKVDLLELFDVVYNNYCIGQCVKDVLRMHYENLNKLSQQFCFEKTIQELNKEIKSIFSGCARTCIVSPNIRGILPIYNSPNGVCIVIEIRKGDIVFLQEINDCVNRNYNPNTIVVAPNYINDLLKQYINEKL